MKRINMDELPGVLKKCPPRGSVTLRPLGAPGSNEVVVPSFTGRPMEYRCSVIMDGGDWFAQCSCSGFTKLSKHEEPIKPCVHSGYLIRENVPAAPSGEATTPTTTANPVPQAGDIETKPETAAEHCRPLKARGGHNSWGEPIEETATTKTTPAAQPGDVETSVEEPATNGGSDRQNQTTDVVPAPTEQQDGIETRSIWPSGLAVIDACPAAAWGDTDEIIVKSTGIPAVVGSCVHKIGQDIVTQKLDNVPDLTPYLVEYDLEKQRDDVFFPSLFLSQAWSGYKGEPGLSRYFPSPICEKKLEHTIRATDPATGRTVKFRFATKADVLSFSAPTATEMPTSAAVIDWKSGYRDKALAPLQQMWSTAFVVAAQFKTIEKVKVSFVWLRDRQIVTIEFTRDELRKHMERFVRFKAFWNGRTYEKGTQCTYCPRLAMCPGRMQLISSISSGLLGMEDEPIALIHDEHGNLRPTDKLAKAIVQGRFLQKILYSFFDEIAVQLYESGPLPVEGEDGKWIGVTERAGKTTINMETAWPVLGEIFEEEEIRKLAACSKSALQNAVYAKSEYGQKKKAMDSLIGQLEEVKAITRARNSRSPGIITDIKKAVTAPKEGEA